MWFECRDDVLKYRGHQRTIRTLAWWCDDCHEGIVEGTALADSERAFFQLKAEVDRMLDPVPAACDRDTHGVGCLVTA